jgi:uncharacterized membrane protein
MNWAHLHLMLNHLPVVGSLFAVGLVLYAVLRKSPELQKAGLGLLVVVALTALPAFLTGEPAEHAVEELPGVSEEAIEHHEEAASLALAAALVTGAVAAVGLALSRREGVPSRRLVLVCAVLALGTLALMGRTANLGGRIRHPEIAGAVGEADA